MTPPVPTERLHELLRDAGNRHGGTLLDTEFLRDIVRELIASRGGPPPTRDEVIAHEAHGGYWLVSRVNNAGTTDMEPDIRPMVLRVRDWGDGTYASIPGVDYGSDWDDDTFRLMPNATWTPLDRDGAVMVRAAVPVPVKAPWFDEQWAATLAAVVARWGPPKSELDGRTARVPMNVRSVEWGTVGTYVRVEEQGGRMMLLAHVLNVGVELWHLAGRPWTDASADVPVETAMDEAEAWIAARDGEPLPRVETP